MLTEHEIDGQAMQPGRELRFTAKPRQLFPGPDKCILDVLFGLGTIAVDQPSRRSEEHTSELQSLMRISYAVFCLKKKNSQCSGTHSNPVRCYAMTCNHRVTTST